MANKPNIRFKGFTDDWEQRKLGEITNKGTKKNTELQYNETFTNSAEFGIISQSDFFDHSVSNPENICGYYIVENNSFVYNPRISNLAPVGPINRNKLGRIGIMSPLYTVFEVKNINVEYLEWFFKSSHWHSFMYFNGDTGARADRFSIKDTLFFEMPIPIPDIDEQAKIGEYFSTLDHLITLHQRKCDETKKLKKFMLQKMFPKNGEKNPEIRFAGFTDDWEQRKLGEVIDAYNEKKPKNIDLPVLTSSRQGIQKQEEHFGSEQKHDTKDYNVIPMGYCTYRNRSDDKTFTFNINHSVKRGIVSKFYPVFSIINGNAKFITEFLNNNLEIKNKLAVLAVGTSQVVLSFANLKELEICVPSKLEQDKIGNYIETLDHLITLHQRKCDNLKFVKKFMLQNMFPQKG